MDNVIAFFQSELGRRLISILLTLLSGAGASGNLPIDVPIGNTGLTTSQGLLAAAIAVATTSGSSTRK